MRKRTNLALWVLGVLVFLFVTLLALISLFPGHADVGLIDGKLKPCPDKPNCVCSEEETTKAYIAPISIRGSTQEAWIEARDAVEELGGWIEKESEGYLLATFKTPILRFIDDVELRLDEEKGVIHLRSASRLGHSDLGVNRKRMEELTRLFRAPTPSDTP